MAAFSGKIVSAFYADEEYADIKIRYEEDDKLFVYMVPNDPDNEEYQELVAEGWDTEKLIDETAERLKAESNAYNTRINEEARALIQEKMADLDKKMKDVDRTQAFETAEELYSHIIYNENEEEVFKFKLWALEQDFVKDAPTDQKKALRRAKTLLEGMSVLHVMK